ncbi:MAG: IS1 family transposase [Pararhodobacter sp.]|nr:IS1 family transposase [Pararhodobacter sp.]
MTVNIKPIGTLPDWVPSAVRLYLRHTENGRSLRQLAREEGVHASTVLRQVRRFESRRDDPLIDCALGRLRQRAPGNTVSKCETKKGRETVDTVSAPDGKILAGACLLSEDQLNAEVLRVLRRLCEPGALLAVAADMERAVVLREGAGGTMRLAVLDRPVAEAFALRDWIQCRKPGRVAQYEITTAGRAALRRLLAEAGETAPKAALCGPEGAARVAGMQGEARPRGQMGESPVTALARRRDRYGKPFLTPDLVAAAERLREDFEIAQIGPRLTQDWERFLTAGTSRAQKGASGASGGARAARERVGAALRELGPGLGDMALRCCCYLEGLEAAERHLGWSARSGKIVLRIALTRLKRHYEAMGDSANMIG